MFSSDVPEDLEGLCKRISELVSDLSDKEKRAAVSNELDSLVEENRDSIALILPKWETWDNAKKYFEMARRLEGEEKLMETVLEPQTSSNFQRALAREIHDGCFLVSKDFGEIYQIITNHLYERLLTADPIPCIRATRKFRSGDPSVVLDILGRYPTPSYRFFGEKYRWAEYPYLRSVKIFFHRMGKPAIQPLLEVMTYEKYQTMMRAHAAIELREIDDADTNSKLLKMMSTEHVKYAAKALTNSKDPATIDAFMTHWSKIDKYDWAARLANEEMIPKLVDLIVGSETDVDLKDRCINLLIFFEDCKTLNDDMGQDPHTVFGGREFNYLKLGSAKVAKEQYQKILDFYVRHGYMEEQTFHGLPEKKVPLKFGKLLFFLDVEGQQRFYQSFIDFFNIIKNPNQPPELRINAMKAIRSEDHLWKKYYKETKDATIVDYGSYLRSIGSRLTGWRREPNKTVRRAARKYYFSLQLPLYT